MGTTRSRDSSPEYFTRRRLIINSFITLLVISGIIGASLFLFARQPKASGSVSNLPLAAHSEAGGLEMSMSLTPGPYFLGEMIAVNLLITNHTNKTYYVGPPFASDACGYATGITTLGGEAPYYPLSIATDHSCPPQAYRSTALQPGQTLTSHTVMPLTSSGNVTQKAEIAFFTAATNVNSPQTISRSSTSTPLDGHWPSKQLYVSPKIPADRQLSFSSNSTGTQITINAPANARAHLFYLYGLSCQSPHNNMATGNYGWEPLKTNTITRPGCSATNIKWDFAFGAPGYAIATGGTGSITSLARPDQS